MTGRPFEWMFVLPDVENSTDVRFDLLTEQIDAVVESHSHLTVVTVLVDGATAVEAGRTAINILRTCELAPSRSHPDLVSVSEIARRADVSRQAVRNWIIGTRHSDTFPAPANLTGGGVWLWGDVAPWLEARGRGEPDDVSYPVMDDHIDVDANLKSTNEAPNLYCDWFPLVANRLLVRSAPQPESGGAHRKFRFDIPLGLGLEKGFADLFAAADSTEDDEPDSEFDLFPTKNTYALR